MIQSPSLTNRTYIQPISDLPKTHGSLRSTNEVGSSSLQLMPRSFLLVVTPVVIPKAIRKLPVLCHDSKDRTCQSLNQQPAFRFFVVSDVVLHLIQQNPSQQLCSNWNVSNDQNSVGNPSIEIDLDRERVRLQKTV